ncbi:P27 family phage terminase small subunit [Methylobacterium sp.]|uniref:P27 family phage terminase small subunit n=1 Tax=Methylobacterium sp. TaxID=409 RepID=UPI003C765783
MARRKDDPGLQAAKGFPGRRKSKVLKEVAAAASSAEADAARGEPFGVPSLFRKAPTYYRRAIQEWEAQSDTLRAAGRRRPGFRSALARYCMWTLIYESSVDQLRRDCPKGDFIVDWTPVGGSTRRIPHPALKIMADAEPILRNLEGEFGFTPRSDSDLVRVESFNRSQMRLPLGDGGASPRAPEEGRHDQMDPMGLMDALDSAPPTVN